MTICLRPCTLLLSALLVTALPSQAAFTANANGTVTDTVTGLVWDKCTYGPTVSVSSCGTAQTYTWQDALATAITANASSYKGNSDWRLPNLNELESIVDLSTSSPSIDVGAFPATPSDAFWSSTSFASDPTKAESVGFNLGSSGADATTTTYYVRLVRGGQPLAAFDSLGINITASAGAGGSLTCLASQVASGATTSCTATPDTGYTTQSISGCNGVATGPGVNSYTTGAITAACTVSASFTLNTYAITATASPVAGGTVSCTPNPVNHGSTASCTATPNAGYSFSAFSGDCTGATCSLSNVTSAKAVTATFTQNTYAITATASPLAGGTVSCTPVTHGASASCTATPNSGYRTQSISGCNGAATGLGVNSYTTGAVNANCTVTAAFELIPPPAFTVTASPGSNGALVCTNTTVNQSATTTCTATPNSGYRTQSISGCNGTATGLGVNSYTTGAVNANCTVTAAFELIPPPTFTVTASPGSNGALVCTNTTVNQGATTTCTATPNSGYRTQSISGCNGAATGLGVNSYTTGAVTAACSVAANFVLNTTSSGTPPPGSTGSGTISTTLSGGGTNCGFNSVSYVAPSSTGTTPPSVYTYPYGAVKFNTNSTCDANGGITLTVTYPSTLPAGTKLYKFGPVTAGAASTWYEHPATISGNTIVYTVTDNGQGDNDSALSTISDPAVAAVPIANAASDVTSVPTLGEWALLLLATLMGMFGMKAARRRG